MHGLSDACEAGVRRIPMAVVVAAISWPAWGDPGAANDRFLVSGAGMASCGQYLELVRKGDEAALLQYDQWVLEFIARVNADSKRTVNPPDATTTRAWMDKWCRQHPQQFLIAGSSALIAELRGPAR